MKFAIFRELEKGKRKFLVEWDQEQIIDAVIKQICKVVPKDVVMDPSPGLIRGAFQDVIHEFKKESLRIP